MSPAPHGHDHGAHGHHHPSAPGPGGSPLAFAAGAGLNAAFVALQVAFGLRAGSVALLSDAVHNGGDVLGLLLSWAAAAMARRRPTARRTYGWGRGTILAPMLNAVVLLVGVGAVAAEAARRLAHPDAVAGGTVARIAALGIVVNGVSALLFASGRTRDLNIRAAFVHMASDAALSAGVAVAGVLVMLTGAAWIDPLCSLALAALIARSAWSLLRESADLALDAMPPGLAAAEIGGFLRALPGVTEVHDLHVWAISSTQTALTAHLVHRHAGPGTDASTPGSSFPPGAGSGDARGLIRLASEGLRERFGIGHCTLQLEGPDEAERCALRPEHVA